VVNHITSDQNHNLGGERSAGGVPGRRIHSVIKSMEIIIFFVRVMLYLVELMESRNNYNIVGLTDDIWLV
jgi:hypothetical protein